MFLGIDSGGTFTDFILFDGKGIRLHKQLSTPDDPSHAILEGIRTLNINVGDLHLLHGSTVATNAILEQKGVRTLFVTNSGIEDLLAIGRQNRHQLYNLTPSAEAAHPAPTGKFGIDGRIDADGKPLGITAPETLNELTALSGQFDAVAVCTLFSFLNPEEEQAIAAAIPESRFTALSHEVLAEYREYERASTTFLTAYVGPLVQRYLNRLRTELKVRHLFVMHSAGGVMSASEAGRNAARMVLSGPAGGLVAAGFVGKQIARDKLLTFDMGGTSTDVSLLDAGGHGSRITTEGSICGMPVAVPMLDIHTIGAGGGSIAWIDEAGLPSVGPLSAGADPGPACYGRGGLLPTVTDANLVLGRLSHDTLLGGEHRLDLEAARTAVGNLGEEIGISCEQMALGILQIAEESMAGALRVVSLQKGHDPGDYSLLCFGGAGGLHACALAEKLRMRRIVLPLGSGAFSALGMLAGRRQCDLSLSRRLSLDAPDTPSLLDELFDRLELQAGERMPELTLQFEHHVDLRFEGQGFQLTLPFQENSEALVASFVQAHEQAYGHTLDHPVEIMTLRLTAFADTPALELPELERATKPPEVCGDASVHAIGTVSRYRREALRPGHCIEGPAIITEPTSTLWLAPGWELEVSPHGHLLLESKS